MNFEMRNWFIISNCNEFIIMNDLKTLNIEVNYCVRSRFRKYEKWYHIDADMNQIKQIEKMLWCKSVLEV